MKKTYAAQAHRHTATQPHTTGRTFERNNYGGCEDESQISLFLFLSCGWVFLSHFFLSNFEFLSRNLLPANSRLSREQHENQGPIQCKGRKWTIAIPMSQSPTERLKDLRYGDYKETAIVLQDVTASHHPHKLYRTAIGKHSHTQHTVHSINFKSSQLIYSLQSTNDYFSFHFSSIPLLLLLLYDCMYI